MEKEIEDRWDAAFKEADYWVTDDFDVMQTNHQIHIMLQKAFLHGVMWAEEQKEKL